MCIQDQPFSVCRELNAAVPRAKQGACPQLICRTMLSGALLCTASRMLSTKPLSVTKPAQTATGCSRLKQPRPFTLSHYGHDQLACLVAAGPRRASPLACHRCCHYRDQRPQDVCYVCIAGQPVPSLCRPHLLQRAVCTRRGVMACVRAWTAAVTVVVAMSAAGVCARHPPPPYDLGLYAPPPPDCAPSPCDRGSCLGVMKIMPSWLSCVATCQASLASSLPLLCSSTQWLPML